MFLKSIKIYENRKSRELHQPLHTLNHEQSCCPNEAINWNNATHHRVKSRVFSIDSPLLLPTHMRERGTRYPRIKRNWQVVGSNLHTPQPKLFLHAAARSFSIYYRGNESRELLDFCPAPPMKFTPACFRPTSSFSFQRSNPRKIRLSSITIRKYCGGPVCHVLLWVVLLLYSFYTARKRFRDMTPLSDFNKIWFLFPMPRLSLTASETSLFLRDEFKRRILNDDV